MHSSVKTWPTSRTFKILAVHRQEINTFIHGDAHLNVAN